MVCNANLVLDSGMKKYVPEPKGDMKSLPYKILSEIYAKSSKNKVRRVWDEEANDYVKIIENNEEYKELGGKILWWINKWDHGDPKTGDCLRTLYGKGYNKHKEDSWERFYNSEKEIIYEYLGRIPFNPCVMINISPDWKGKKIDNLMTKHFTKVIDKYLNESNRYSKWKYCLESGSEGDFLHAHIVAEINPDLEKSVMTHINKGNHAVQLRKAWDSLNGGYQKGKLKGKYSIQRVILRTEVLRDEKLEYLVEDLKPEGHKNKKDLQLTFVNGF